MAKATELKQFINTFSSDPLNNDNFDEFYVDTSEVRGDEMKKLEDTLLKGSYPYTKILFSGQAGSGATTELYNLAKKLKNRYEIINISALYDLNVYNMSYVDIVFEIMAATLLYYKDHMTELSGISEEDFSQLYNYWHSEHFITSLFVGYAEDFIKYETLSDGTRVISDLEFLLKVAIAGRNILRTSGKTKKELQTKIEPRVNDLIAAINSTIKTINDNLNGKELLFIIDDLRKADRRFVSEIFIKYYMQLSAINTKVIFNIPISLELSWAFKEITGNENANFVLNTIKVVNNDGSQNIKNIQFLKRLVYKRAEETLFDEAALEFIIIKSGGILKYLFSMLVDASFNAMLEHPDMEKILMKDAIEACTKMRDEYIKSIISKRGIPQTNGFLFNQP